jgi:hypothetical protein
MKAEKCKIYLWPQQLKATTESKEMTCAFKVFVATFPPLLHFLALLRRFVTLLERRPVKFQTLQKNEVIHVASHAKHEQYTILNYTTHQTHHTGIDNRDSHMKQHPACAARECHAGRQSTHVG